MKAIQAFLAIQPNSSAIQVFTRRPFTFIFTFLLSLVGLLTSLCYSILPIPVVVLECPNEKRTRPRPPKLISTPSSSSLPLPISPKFQKAYQDHYLHNPSQFTHPLEVVTESEESIEFKTEESESMTEDDGTISESSMEDISSPVREKKDQMKRKESKTGRFLQECVARRRKEEKKRSKLHRKHCSEECEGVECAKPSFKSFFKSKSSSPLSKSPSTELSTSAKSSWEGSWAEVAKSEGINWN